MIPPIAFMMPTLIMIIVTALPISGKKWVFDKEDIFLSRKSFFSSAEKEEKRKENWRR